MIAFTKQEIKTENMKKQKHTPSKDEQLAVAICMFAAIFLFTGLLFFAITKH